MTFHVRLVSAPDRTGGLLEALASDPGVSSLVVLPGAARRPGGDAVQFDVAARSANSVFRQLKAFQDGRSSTVAVEYVDATLGEEPTPASKHFLVQRDIAPVWELVEARIRSDAVYAPSFYILLAIAGLIGAVGILTNSQILIVGAMVVGPEYNAIIGVALGIDKRARRPVLRGLLALLVGFLAAIVVTLLFGLVIRWSGPRRRLYPAGVRPVSRPDQQSGLVLGRRRGAGRDRRRGLAHRGPGQRPHRRLHLGHHHPGRRRHRPVRSRRELGRGPGGGPAAAERGRADRWWARAPSGASGSSGVRANGPARQPDRAGPG